MGLARRKWFFREADEGLVADLAAQARLSPICSRLMVNRGISDAAAAGSYLRPGLPNLHDPMVMADMPWAVEKLLEALHAGRAIAVYGDYDVDGITGTAILLEFLRPLSPKVSYFIPERLQDGYGLKVENLSALRLMGVDLIITVDCGISNRTEIEAARALGLDFIVTDHHPCPARPEGVPVLDPQRTDCPYPNKDLAGAGVAFKFVQALRTALGASGGGADSAAGADGLEPFLEMAAIGTIGDVVPLTGENRALVSLGLEALRRTARPGLAALKEVSGLAHHLDATSVAYYLVPRLNASGRLGKADRGVHLFLEEDAERAACLARDLSEENRYRQRLEAEILDEAKKVIERDGVPEGAIVLASDLWHPGVIGIVASRLVDLYNRPAVLLAGEGDVLKGSIRSVAEIPLPELLADCSEHLISFGGHRLAAGFMLRRENLDGFRRRFSGLAAGRLVRPEDHPGLALDMEVDLRDLRMSLLEELAALQPFGCGNPAPVFVSRRVHMAREPEVFAERHLRLQLYSHGREIKAVGFKMGHLAPMLWRQAPLDVVYTPEISRSGGRQEIVLNLKDLDTEYSIEDGADDED